MQTFHHWLAWVPTAAYLLGALSCTGVETSGRWKALAVSTRAALIASISGGAATLMPRAGQSSSVGLETAALVGVLISFLGWIIGDFSHRYLRGEPGQRRFTASFLMTLAGSSAVVASPNLAILILAWTTSSAGLHHLLTYYPERTAAVVVAHKKFLASRLAEACLVLAAALLYREWGTLDLQTIAERAASIASLPMGVEAAASLIALAVILKCAQLPLHGWLIQVMEAPTPVSALLHAGVVNLGGFVLIRMGPLISASAAAQSLLVLVGSLTAVLAGLVMLTRVTIKVRLAWSTCSQMGLMVLECGLGLYDLALLHLLAHALYKAHAFLSSGEAVQAALLRAIMPSTAACSRRATLSAPAVALAFTTLVTSVSTLAWHQVGGVAEPHWVAIAFLSCGLATLLWSPIAQRRFDWRAALGVLGAVQLYLGWHWLIAAQLGMGSRPPLPFLAVWAAIILLALYFAQARALATSSGLLERRLHDWVYAGFYLDERFTRLTFRLWPPRAAGN